MSDPEHAGAPRGPKPGTTLAGKYLIEEVLGVGGMGVVVAAKHLQLDQRVAIKYLLPQARHNLEVVERFAREAKAAAKIRGEHVARVIDVSTFDDGAPYMVLEYLDGHDLAKQLERHGPLPVEDAIRYLLETCEALAQAHAAKIVHRDLKPSNLFLAEQPDKRWIIKVLDFGISKIGDQPSAALTKTSALMGTAFYMSPEQLVAPKTVDHRSDIWSLGVILYELLTGKPPFLGESVPEIVGAILTNKPQPMRTMRPDLPAGLDDIVAKCMQSNANDRYASVAALAAALGPFASFRDRMSIDMVARVLGETATLMPTTVLAPARAPVVADGPADPAPGVAPELQSAPWPLRAADGRAVAPSSPSSGEDGVRPSAGPVTSQGLSSSTITPKPKNYSAVLVAVATTLIVGGVAAWVVVSRKEGKLEDRPASGLVAPAPEPTSTTSVLPAATQPVHAPSTVLTPLPLASETTTAPATSVVVSAKASGAANPVVGAPAVRSPGSSTPKPSPSATAVASSLQPIPPPSAGPVATASSKPNPLQMGIK